MRNIWITVSYEGTNYGGFQRQDNRMTVQEMLENCLLTLTKQKTTIYFVARTDAGVHAYGQECTFYTESSIPGDRFMHAMNVLLPPDIRVRQSRDMDEDFSVRRGNFGKTYGYLLTENRQASPFLKRYIWRTGKKLDLQKMEAVARVLEGTHDFTSFRGNNSVPSDPVRKINEIRIVQEGELYRIYVTGEGFLYHMVRNIAGALVDAGIGALTPKQVKDILAAKDRRKLGITAPAEGLCLLKVYFEPITKKLIDNTLKESLFPWTF
ncbi:MAG TPA: tRNA pseudouridine(38-40) synthase TruA [Dialister sp.]|mgnify:CR=1 FL=1|nr:tRNA pseudouridine(38-40) synthase TruA [Dialister sp.]